MYLIGYVIKPHGIRGEIKVQPVSPDTERFRSLKRVFIQHQSLQSFSIEGVRISNQFVFLKLTDVDNRNAAEELRGAELLIEKENLVTLDQDEFFVHDLIGCLMITETGMEIGRVTEVMQISSNDVYVVQDSSGKEILVPAIKDIIKKIDLPAKTITIRLIEGLLD